MGKSYLAKRVKVAWLFQGVIPEGGELAALPAEAVSGRREDGAGEFTLPGEFAAGGCHAYVYFAREDGTAWSPSRHFRIG